jgi:hypothetical protein
MEQLLLVADTFFQAQQQRHTADYDNAKQWTRTETLELIQQVTLAFHSWRAVRDQSAAQEASERPRQLRSPHGLAPA